MENYPDAHRTSNNSGPPNKLKTGEALKRKEQIIANARKKRKNSTKTFEERYAELEPAPIPIREFNEVWMTEAESNRYSLALQLYRSVKYHPAFLPLLEALHGSLEGKETKSDPNYVYIVQKAYDSGRSVTVEHIFSTEQGARDWVEANTSYLRYIAEVRSEEEPTLIAYYDINYYDRVEIHQHPVKEYVRE